MLFRARQFEFHFPRPALVMGIVNVTPDSFSDGGKYLDSRAAIAHALNLAAEGADILDIGGESTRPGAGPVGETEELRRILPVIEALTAQTRLPISVDTMKPAVAQAALAAGASIVNDISAGRNNPAMWQCVKDFGAGYIAMHAQGLPPLMQFSPAYHDVVREIFDFFSDQLKQLPAAGITSDQIVLDPGIGFGKTPEHNLQLLGGLKSYLPLGRPLLIGVSRKSFLAKFSGASLNERLPASLACATLAVESGVHIIRAHDVKETVQALRMAEAVLSRKQSCGLI